MSPNQQLGRLLHTVSATGYEVMEAQPKKMLEQSIMAFSHIDSYLNNPIDEIFGNLVAASNYVYMSDATN
jgi:hypothetical protein